MTKESKHNTKENYQTQGKRERGEERKLEELHKHTENNEQNGNKYMPINNYFKCK